MASCARLGFVAIAVSVHCTVQAQNLALNQPVTVDSVDVSRTWLPGGAVDGIWSSASRWISDYGNGSHFMVVDLGVPCTITEVDIWAGAGSEDYGLCTHTIDMFTLTAPPGVSSGWAANQTVGWNTMFSASFGVHFQHVGVSVARFVRLSVNQIAACRRIIDTRVRIIEFQVQGTPAPVGTALGGVPITNVAIGKPVIASSFFAPNGSTANGPSMAIDGNSVSFSSRWISLNESLAWIAVDLGQMYNIVRFSVYSASTATRTNPLCSHLIQVWTGSPTASLANVVASTTVNWAVVSRRIQPSFNGGVEHDEIQPVSARFVMLVVNASICGNAPTQVGEFEVYGTTSAIVMPNATLQNVAQGKIAVADSVAVNTTATASLAVDGVTTGSGSQWISDRASPLHWLAVDLQGYFLISGVTVVAENLGMGLGLCSYSLQVWAGDSDASIGQAGPVGCGWVTVMSQPNVTATSRTHSDFTPVIAQMVRLSINQGTCINNTLAARVYEFQVFGVEQEDDDLILADGTNSTLVTYDSFPNIALNKPAIADSVLGNYTANFAFDNDTVTPASRWVSTGNTTSHWLAVNLQGLYLIRGIEIVAGLRNSYALCAHNISFFTGLASVTPLEVAVTQPSMWLPLVVGSTPIISEEHTAIAPTYAQYIMLSTFQSTCNGDNISRVYELSIYGSPAANGVTTPSTVSNVALQKQAYASSYLNATFPYLPQYAVDGNDYNMNSRWVSNFSDPLPWLVVDLGASYSILGSSIVVGWTDTLCLAGICDYDIMVWTGAFVPTAVDFAGSVNWMSVVMHRGYTHSDATHDDLPPGTTARFVKLDVNQTSCGQFSPEYDRPLTALAYVRVFEFKIYGILITSSPTFVPTSRPTTNAPTMPRTNAPSSRAGVVSTIATLMPSTGTTASPNSQQTGASGGSSGGGSSSTDAVMPIVVGVVVGIVALVVIIAVIILKKKSTPTENRGAVSFENPLYDERSVPAAAEPDGGYMDVPVPDDTDDSTGYMEPAEGATTGYMDVDADTGVEDDY